MHTVRTCSLHSSDSSGSGKVELCTLGSGDGGSELAAGGGARVAHFTTRSSLLSTVTQTTPYAGLKWKSMS